MEPTESSTEQVQNGAIRHSHSAVGSWIVFLTALIFLAVAWVGLQVAFPLVPAFGGVARNLSPRLQVFGIIALLAISVFGACQPVVAWARKHWRNRLANMPERFGVEDPRFMSDSTQQCNS